MRKIETREHVFYECEIIQDTYSVIKKILSEFISQEVSNQQLILLAFNHRKVKKRKVALWFVIKALYSIYLNRLINKEQLLKELLKDIDWNLNWNNKIGSKTDIIELRGVIHSLNIV